MTKSDRESAIDRCIETNRRAVRALVSAVDECRACLESHAEMKDAQAEAERLVAEAKHSLDIAVSAR